MRQASILAAALFAICLFGIRAHAQQEVDPTSYPLPQTMQYKLARPEAPRAVKQSSTHAAQPASGKKAPKAATTTANAKEAKIVAKR